MHFGGIETVVEDIENKLVFLKNKLPTIRTKESLVSFINEYNEFISAIWKRTIKLNDSEEVYKNSWFIIFLCDDLLPPSIERDWTKSNALSLCQYCEYVSTRTFSRPTREDFLELRKQIQKSEIIAMFGENITREKLIKNKEAILSKLSSFMDLEALSEKLFPHLSHDNEININKIKKHLESITELEAYCKGITKLPYTPPKMGSINGHWKTIAKIISNTKLDDKLVSFFIPLIKYIENGGKKSPLISMMRYITNQSRVDNDVKIWCTYILDVLYNNSTDDSKGDEIAIIDLMLVLKENKTEFLNIVSSLPHYSFEKNKYPNISGFVRDNFPSIEDNAKIYNIKKTREPAILTTLSKQKKEWEVLDICYLLYVLPEKKNDKEYRKEASKYPLISNEIIPKINKKKWFKKQNISQKMFELYSKYCKDEEMRNFIKELITNFFNNYEKLTEKKLISICPELYLTCGLIQERGD